METTENLTSIVQVLEYLRTQNLAEYAQIVGRWVWLEFPDKPSAEVRAGLTAVGFRWNRKRSCWQHSCGHHCVSSPADSWYLKSKYGTVLVSGIEIDTQAA
ncbi:MAG: hypothetical protein V2A79_09900 [Planctomycetota bacterium]